MDALRPDVRPDLLGVPPSETRTSLRVTCALLALGVALTVILLPLAGRRGPELPGIHVLFDAGVCVADLATSAFLLLRFRRSGSWSGLILTGAYLYSGLMAIAYCLTYPGALMLGRPLIGSVGSSSWVFLFWTLGYAGLCLLAVILATHFTNSFADRAPATGLTVVAGASVGALVMVAFFAVLAFASLPAGQLPVLVVGSQWTGYDTVLSDASSIALACGIALTLLTARRQDELLLWLGVALAGVALGNVLSVMGGSRYTVGWYAFRLSWFGSSCVLLVYFIVEFAKQRDLLVRANDDLQARTRERDRIWNVSEDLLGVATIDGYFASINPAWTKTLGWREAEIKSMPVSELQHPDDPQLSTAVRARLAEGAQTLRMENRFRHRDGSWRWIAWTMTAENGLIYVAGRDVTAEKEAHEELRKRQAAGAHRQKMEALGQLTGGVAHDFNNLLTVVGGHASMIKNSIAKDSRAAKSADAIEGAVNRGEALTRQLLSFSHRQPVNPGIVEVGHRVQALRPMLLSSLGSSADLLLELPKDLWSAKVDVNEFELAIVNLVLNARDALHQGGAIKIQARNARLEPTDLPQNLQGEFVTVTVSDAGTGIAPDILPKVFDPFFTTKETGKGTGLGLSQVHGFAYQSGGAISIWSELGRGTAITLYLPRGLPVAEPAASSAPERVPGGKALLVEDNPDVAEIAREMLGQMGYDVHLAHDARGAVEAINVREFDLLVSDIVMAGAMNGFDLARTVRERKRGLPILLVTGYSQSAERAMSEFTVLRKPYKAVDLRAAIARAVESAGTAGVPLRSAGGRR